MLRVRQRSHHSTSVHEVSSFSMISKWKRSRRVRVGSGAQGQLGFVHLHGEPQQTLSSTSRCIAFGGAVRQRSKHGPRRCTDFRWSRTLILSAALKKTPRLLRAREVSSPPRHLGQDARLSHLRIKEKAILPRLSVPHSHQHREFKATRRASFASIICS